MYFPFDLFQPDQFVELADRTARDIVRLEPYCLKPPWPWGHWLYAALIDKSVGALEGDFVECGVGKGGTSAFLGHFAKRFRRRAYALDTFCGLPEPDPSFDSPYFKRGDYGSRQDRGPLLSRFSALLAKEDLEEVVRPVAGLFQDTLPSLGDVRFAFVHIDADLYRSVLQCLQYLWPRVVHGGFVAIDDFFHHSQGAARAASCYFSERGERPVFHVSFPYSVVLRKGDSAIAERRALDGNVYSLEFLKNDALFTRAVSESRRKATVGRAERAATNADLLLKTLLSSGRSSAIYDYWRALEEYWDDMDANSPDLRPALVI